MSHTVIGKATYHDLNVNTLSMPSPMPSRTAATKRTGKNLKMEYSVRSSLNQYISSLLHGKG